MFLYRIDGVKASNGYNLAGSIVSYAYNYKGSQVFPYDPELTLLNNVTMATLNPDTTITPQGLAVYGNYIFQFFTGDNKMRIFNKTTYSLENSYSATDIKHANTMQFANSVQNTGFPLLYVSEWGDSGASSSSTIDILKVSLSGYEIVDSFTLPSSAGYHPSFTGDWTNNTGYSVGFAENTSTTTTQPNVITKYSLTDMSILEQYQVPYMGVLNGWEFYNGTLIYTGNTWNGSTALFYFIDATTHNVSSYSFSKTTNEEYEGFAVSGNNLICSNWINNGTLYYRFYFMNLI